MHYDEIDELIKRSLQETGRRSENHAMDAKLRVWDAIEKPKNKKGIHIGFVMAMAAAVTFFLVSTFLFFRLESKQNELIALKASVKTEIPTKTFQNEIPKQEEKQVAAIDTERIAKSTQEAKIEEVLVKKQSQNIAEVIDLKETEPLPEVIFPMEKAVAFPEADLQIISTLINELKADLDSPIEIKEENLNKPKSKTKNKLRLRFGSSNPNYNPGNSLALNIKL
jgi:hypothetical protein